MSKGQGLPHATVIYFLLATKLARLFYFFSQKFDPKFLFDEF
jgi:hypothetical protein